MNKIDKAVHDLKGVLPDLVHPAQDARSIDVGCYFLLSDNVHFKSRAGVITSCTKAEFEKRARELGYINGYRWGVEYPTSGEKPDLPDDVCVQWQSGEYGNAWLPDRGSTTAGELGWTNGRYRVDSFKITDERYKPADTSYLDAFSAEHLAHTKTTDTTIEFESVKASGEFAFDVLKQDATEWYDYAAEFERVHSACKERYDREFAAMFMETLESVAKQMGSPFDALKQDDSDWYDYGTQKALRLPPVGTKCIYFHDSLSAGHEVDVLEISSDETFAVVSLSSVEVNKITFYARARQLVPLDYETCKAEAERKRVVDAAIDSIVISHNRSVIRSILEQVYDAGYLRMPPEKN